MLYERLLKFPSLGLEFPGKIKIRTVSIIFLSTNTDIVKNEICIMSSDKNKYSQSAVATHYIPAMKTLSL
jgi:hypothetical protein